MPPSILPRMFSSLLLILFLVWLFMAGFVYLAQPALLYFPLRELDFTPRSVDLDYEDVELDSADGERLHGWWIPHPQARGALLFLHGNGGNISHRLESIRLFHELGLGVLIIDYRGYGRSSGRPDEAGTYLDAAAGWRHLLEARGIDPARTVIYGESLGGAVAIHQAVDARCGALIVSSTFTSIVDIGRHHYPYLPVSWLARFRYPGIDLIGRAGCPVLILHGPEDEIVPFAMGEQLFAAAPEPKQFVRLAGGHNDGLLADGPRVRQSIDAFLDRHLPR